MMENFPIPTFSICILVVHAVGLFKCLFYSREKTGFDSRRRNGARCRKWEGNSGFHKWYAYQSLVVSACSSFGNFSRPECDLCPNQRMLRRLYTLGPREAIPQRSTRRPRAAVSTTTRTAIQTLARALLSGACCPHKHQRRTNPRQAVYGCQGSP